MVNSKNKGKVGELEVVHLLKKHGFESARRGQQFKGTPDSPDVECEELSDYNIEVKRTEGFNLYKAMKQSESDAGDKIPTVWHRRNKEEWVVILKATDFLNLIKEK